MISNRQGRGWFQSQRRLWCALAVGCLFFSVAYGEGLNVLVYQQLLADNRPVRLEGSVVQTNTWDGGGYVDLIPTGINPLNSQGRIRVFYQGSVKYTLGEVLKVSGRGEHSQPAPPRHFLWWNPFSLTDFTLDAGQEGIEKVETPSFTLRSNLLNKILEIDGITDFTRGLIISLLLGERGFVDSSFWDRARKLGVIHLFALSGLHLGIYVSILAPFSKKRPYWALVCSLGVFLALSGGPPSAVRAAGFGLYTLLARLGSREGRMGKRGILQILLALLWLNPAYLFDLGFRLSLCAVWSIGLYSQVVGGVRANIGSGVDLSFFISACLLPILVCCFGYATPWGPLLTICMLPLITALLGLSIMGLPLLLLGLGAAYFSWLGWLLDGLAQLVNLLMILAQKVPGHKVVTGTLGVTGILSILAIIGKLALNRLKSGEQNQSSWRPGFGFTVYVTVFSLVLTAGFFTDLGRRLSPWLRLTALNVGQGDSFHLALPGGRDLLLDSGGGNQFRVDDWIGKSVVLTYLNCSKVDRLDSLIVSHWHSDHYMGFLPVLQEVPARNRISPGGLAIPLISAKSKSQVYRGKRGLSFYSQGVQGKTLFPEEQTTGYLTDPNRTSIVLVLNYQLFSLLFTGDLPPGEQRRLAKADSLSPVTVLKIPHHGGRSTTWDLLSATTPILGLMPGEPRVETVDTLEGADCKWYSTKTHGTISLSTDGSWWRLAQTRPDSNTSVALTVLGIM